MRVEGRAPNVRPIDDLLHGKGFETFLLEQRPKRASNELLSPLHPPISLSCHPAFLFGTADAGLFDSGQMMGLRSGSHRINEHNVRKRTVYTLQNTCSV